MKKRGIINILKEKKGISPVVATVLLIAIVVVIGLIIFMWFRGMMQDAITKFDGQNIELVCDDVKFDASYSEGTLFVSNIGNIPLYSLNIKISSSGSYETKEITELSSNWPEYGINQAGTFSDRIDFSGATEITLIPVLIGSTDKGQKIHVCDEKQYGYEIIL